jgi:hypothetical protein
VAAPAYATDLADINLAETTTGWAALGGGASGLSASPDIAMQGPNCIDKQITNSEKGQVFNNGSGITPGADEHFFIWAFMSTPGLAATLVNRGLAAVIGSATTAYVQFHVEGSDTYGAVGRVGKCYPIRYVNTANASPPYRTLVGVPGTTPQVFGATANITATVRGSNLGVDAIRRGTGVFVTSGESADPATLEGAAAVNDHVDNRWGVLTRIGGSAYELQGRLVIGRNSSGTPTAAHFVDANKSILLVDTPHSLVDFTQIVIDHASTVFEITNYTVEAAGTNNRGKLVFVSGAGGALAGCNFVNIGTSELRSGVTAVGCTWRGCDQITANGASLVGSTISGSVAATSALLWDTATDTNGKLDGTEFVMGTGGHGLELGPNTPNSISLVDVDFSVYGADGTANAALYNNSGKALTINISGGSTPTVRNGAGASTDLVSDQRTFSFAVRNAGGSPITGYEWRLYEASGVPGQLGTVELDGEETAGSSTQSYLYGYAANLDVVLQILHGDYIEQVIRTTLINADQHINVVLSGEENI